MSINFSGVQSVMIPQGNVVKITDAAGRVLWQVRGDGKAVLMVEKITSDTYAGETTYTGEQFVLLDIYPKTNGTVTVTYGNLTKTITDTSGAESPNAQKVYFGTFNGVSDSVATPASGELTIEGDLEAFGTGSYSTSSKGTSRCACINQINGFGVATYVPVSAFSGCTGLTSVTISSNITSIGNSAFYGCTGLTSLIIPPTVTNIASLAFSGCTGLMNVVLKNTNTEGSAFSGCTGLTNVGIAESVKSFSGNPFTGCRALTNFSTEGSSFASENGVLYTFDKKKIIAYPSAAGAYSIPSSVTSIGSSAFYGCTGLTNVTIPSSVTSIEGSAFYGCTGLTNVTIPSSVTSIEGSAFSRCTGLTNVTIPEGVKNIGSSAFSGCTGLTNATIPSTVETIESQAFGVFVMSDSIITKFVVTVLPTTPPLPKQSDYGDQYGYDIFGDPVFMSGGDSLSIIVPKGTLNAYKTARGWSEFSAYIKEAT